MKMMKTINIMRIMPFCLLYILVLEIHCMQAAENPAHGLLVFLDQKEKGYVGALSDQLFIALAQKAGPILASTSLLKNVFSEYGKDMKDPSYSHLFSNIVGATPQAQNKELIEIFESLERYQNATNKSMHQEKRAAFRYILLKAVGFNPLEWIIKKVNESLYLFIPISYLEKQGINTSHVVLDTAQEVSNTELQLGLRVNHMQTSRIEDILAAANQKNDSDYFITTLYDDTLQTSSIFCLRSEYRNQPIAMPAWTILITGHGQAESRIVDLKIEDFKKVLDFLEHKILCKLLVYVSCFSAGVNIQAVYNDMTNNLQKTYSFPIIMQALTDAVVFATPFFLNVDRAGNLQITTQKNFSFAKFLQAAAQPYITNYTAIVQHIFKTGMNITPNNTAQIKMPGLEWFSVLEKNAVVGIGTILAQSAATDKPLDIATFFRREKKTLSDPRILLLYASNIPFALELNPSLKAIVSMIPGDAMHNLNSISSTTHSADSIIKMFMRIDSLNYQKLFFIKKINGTDKTIDDVLVIYTKARERNIPPDDKYNCIVYYVENNKLWVKDRKNYRAREVKPQDIREQYQHYVESITGQPQYIPQATYSRIADWKLHNITFPGPLPLSNRAIIETITTDTAIIVQDVVTSISSIQPPHAITLIRQLPGIPLNNTVAVAVTNLIVDKEHNRVLYTLNGRFFDEKEELAQDYMPHYTELLTPQPLFNMRQGALLPINIKQKQFRQASDIAIIQSQSRKRKRND